MKNKILVALKFLHKRGYDILLWLAVSVLIFMGLFLFTMLAKVTGYWFIPIVPPIVLFIIFMSSSYGEDFINWLERR